MYIDSVRIRNFRSIEDKTIHLDNLTVFTGHNDSGKSNLLKALNLFFNGETDFGRKFRFEDDYFRFAQVKKNKAKEVTIEVKFRAPASYKSNDLIIWRKAWRATGQHEDSEYGPIYQDGSQIQPRSKIRFWTSQLKYRYVPAIKGQGYFSYLLGDLHDVLATTIEAKLKDAGKDFVKKIREHTGIIEDYLLKNLELESQIQLPDDLRSLFSTLDFQTGHGGTLISLGKRGDGIQSRHIPSILKFIAEQENKNLKTGSPRVNTIWGYEEPENSLEMSKAFKLAAEFTELSKDVQILLTTHSPAFYSLVSSGLTGIKGYVADQGKANTTQYTDIRDATNLDEQMGILHLITPHVKRANADIEKLRGEIASAKEQLKKHTSSILYLEGETDLKVIRKYAELRPQLFRGFEPYSERSAGHSWVRDKLIAWAHARDDLKAAGLFDRDQAALKSKDELQNYDRVKNAMQGSYVKAFTYDKPGHLIPIFQKGIKMPVCLEEMFPPAAWQYAEAQGWLEARADILPLYNPEYQIVDKAFVDRCKELGLNDNELRYVLYRIKSDSKDDFAKYVCDFRRVDGEKMFAEFEGVFKKVSEFFNA